MTAEVQIFIILAIMGKIDGPMLKYGIQYMNGSRLILPQRKEDHPDRERLEIRYALFAS